MRVQPPGMSHLVSDVVGGLREVFPTCQGRVRWVDPDPDPCDHMITLLPILWKKRITLRQGWSGSEVGEVVVKGTQVLSVEWAGCGGAEGAQAGGTGGVGGAVKEVSGGDGVAAGVGEIARA
jgi:hypothetical protein